MRSRLEEFLNKNYPKEAKIFNKEDINIMLELDWKVPSKVYDFSTLAEMPFEKSQFKDPSMLIKKGFVKETAAVINKQSPISKSLKMGGI